MTMTNVHASSEPCQPASECPRAGSPRVEPRDVAALLVEVLTVWCTRDGMPLTRDQITERAANAAQALTGKFDIRRRETSPGGR